MCKEVDGKEEKHGTVTGPSEDARNFSAEVGWRDKTLGQA